MLERIVNSSGKQYCTKFPDGTTIFFRLLTLKEYRRLLTLKESLELDEIEFQEKVYNLCVDNTYRDLGGNVRAGVLSSIGAFILWASFNTDTVEDEILAAREKYTVDNSLLYYENMKQVILLAYPAYIPDDLDMKDRLELTELFVRAEYMMQLKTKGEYQQINVNKLRQTTTSSKSDSGIDFAKENAELAKANVGTSDDIWSRNRPRQYQSVAPKNPQALTPMEVQNIKQKAIQRAQRTSKGGR